MVCIYCGNKTTVANSRSTSKGLVVWRRRSCSRCLNTVTTNESIDLASSLIVKNDNDLQPFWRDKLFLSVQKSLSHRKSATSDASGLVDTVIGKIVKSQIQKPLSERAQTSSNEIAELTLEVLSKFDDASASYYKVRHFHLRR